MKYFYAFATLVVLVFSTPAMAAGGPDAYGYTWKNNSDPGGPVFGWIDVSTKPGVQTITGLADDNAIPGFINLGFSFHYYWNDYTQLKVGSNGWVAFDNVANIAHCFPLIPSSVAPNNYLAPFMSDLTLGGTGNQGAVKYWSNNVDTFIISYIAVPYWSPSPPDWVGSNDFQVILCRGDSSITFQYGITSAFINLPTCSGDLVMGIENSTGTVGLQVAAETQPLPNTAIKFYYPHPVLLAIQDVLPVWNSNSTNGAIFVFTGQPFGLTTDIKNGGNTAITSPTTVAASVKTMAMATVHTASGTIPSLAALDDTVLTFTNLWTPASTGQYVFETTVTCSQDDNPANNTNITELDVVDACAPTMQLSYVAGGSDGGIAWTGGIGDEGVGVYYAPPVFPYDIVSLQFFIDNNLSNNYTAAIYDDDGPGGTAGTLLYDSLILAPASSAWSTVTLQTPLTIASGGFYVAWLQGGPQIFIGYEFDQPHSYRNYEIITSIWSPYRSNGQQDFLIRATINNYPTVPTAGFTWANSGPLTATFTDNSTPPVATYLWDFGDMQTDATANPTHTYATAGTYTVCQTVASPCGNDMICETIYVCDEPVATFTESTMGDTVTFTDQATGNIESWEWDFGDGNTATSPSPVHGYSAPGTYTVCLTVTDTCGNTDSSCTTIMIISTTTADIQSLIAGVYPVPAGDVLNIQFTSEISGGRIILFDLSGKRLLEQSGVTGKLVELDVASLASGVYFIRIEDENNSCFIRFIKN